VNVVSSQVVCQKPKTVGIPTKFVTCRFDGIMLGFLSKMFLSKWDVIRYTFATCCLILCFLPVLFQQRSKDDGDNLTIPSAGYKISLWAGIFLSVPYLIEIISNTGVVQVSRLYLPLLVCVCLILPNALQLVISDINSSEIAIESITNAQIIAIFFASWSFHSDHSSKTMVMLLIFFLASIVFRSFTLLSEVPSTGILFTISVTAILISIVTHSLFVAISMYQNKIYLSFNLFSKQIIPSALQKNILIGISLFVIMTSALCFIWLGGIQHAGADMIIAQKYFIAVSAILVLMVEGRTNRTEMIILKVIATKTSAISLIPSFIF